MLVLTRKISHDVWRSDNRIEIRRGDDLIEIVLLELKNGGIRVGIQAGQDWNISRPDAVEKARMANVPRRDFK